MKMDSVQICGFRAGPGQQQQQQQQQQHPNSRDISLLSESDRREILLNLDSVQICGFWAGPGNYEKRKRAFFLLKKDHFLLRFFWLVGSKNLTRCIFCGARFARLLVIFLLQTLRPAALLHQMGAMAGLGELELRLVPV